jgi:uncharacterized protein
MQGAPPFAAFEHHKYLSLETFRKNGQAVRTPVWFAGDPTSGNPPKFYVYSEGNSGKAKRIRNNSRVRIAPCDMRGRVRGDFVEASAEIVTGAEAQLGNQLLNRKYFPWKQLLDFFSRFKRRGHDVFTIRPA